jgi:hypothetical protein
MNEFEDLSLSSTQQQFIQLFFRLGGRSQGSNVRISKPKNPIRNVM